MSLPSASPSPENEPLPALADFLSERREHITGLWIDAVRQNAFVRSADQLTDEDLADHLPKLFRDLEALLRGESVAAQVSQDAEAHGQHRWQQGYSQEELLRELGIVSRLLLVHGFDAFEDAHPEVPGPHRRAARSLILRFFEDTATGSIRQYARRRQEQFTALHDQLREADQSLAAAVLSDRDRLADVFQRSPSFIAVLSGPEHVFELTNDRYRQLVGDHRDLLRLPAREALPEVAGQGFFELLDRVYQTGEPFIGNDVRIMLHSDAGQPLKEHFLDFVYLPTRNPDGAISGVFVHGVDWTDRKLTEQALRESEAGFRQLADAMPQIVWTARPDGVLDYTNRRWYEYIDQAEDEVNVADWGARVHPADLAGAAEVWTRAITSGTPYATEFRVRRGDDEYRWFLVRALPIRDANGNILRWYGTCTDIHDQRALLEQNAQLLASERAARAEAERTSRVKDEFLATLSHELRTPLNAILGWTQVLRGDPANTADVEQGLLTIERNARAQNQIIEDLLDMSRIISGKVRLDVQRIDLAQVVEAAVETVRPAAEAKGIRLQPVIDPLARTVSGDPNRLQQVFWNLLSNAIKFTPKGGRVQVVLERVHSHLEVNVIDSGEGIAAEFLPHVFDRFRQADASTTRRHGGLGLGLAIVKQLVELHGGSVHVDSAGDGQGTAFRVMLPLTAIQPDPEPPDEARRHPRSGAEPVSIPPEFLRLDGVRVLVVDDEPDARALVKRLLEDRQASVRTAGSVAEAMNLFREEAPDVLVSDLGMPGEDGFSLIRQVRGLPPEQGGKTPAVALTAYARSEDRLKVILAGFQMHMSKPVEAMELLALVASLTGRTGSF